MIDEYSLDRTGWAQFSDDRKLRYRLARAFHPAWAWPGGIDLVNPWRPGSLCKRVVFVMLNPSTADAFKPDRTVSKCCLFAQRWGADVVEVVNLFALVSTDPNGLDAIDIGDGPDNDDAILTACRGASRVIAAWGNHGWRRGRGAIVREMLRRDGVQLEHLGTTKEGHPLHPLARGKAFIPLTREPVAWSAP